MTDAASSLDYEEQLAQVRRAQEETSTEEQAGRRSSGDFQRRRALYSIALAIGVIGAVIGSAATLIVHWLR